MKAFHPLSGHIQPTILFLIAVFLLGTSNLKAQDFATFAEGWSSISENAAISIGFRSFTIHTLPLACDNDRKPSAFEFVPNKINLKMGDLWHAQSMVVRAKNHLGEFLGAVPIVILSENESNVMRGSAPDGWLKAIGVGEYKIKVRWLCESGVEQEVLLIVSE